MTSVSSDSDERPMKKLRKGTTSCVACRLRKVKCTFEDGRSACRACISRKAQCVEQTEANLGLSRQYREEATRKRVKRLEQLVDQNYGSKAHAIDNSSSTSRNHTAPSSFHQSSTIHVPTSFQHSVPTSNNVGAAPSLESNKATETTLTSGPILATICPNTSSYQVHGVQRQIIFRNAPLLSMFDGPADDQDDTATSYEPAQLVASILLGFKLHVPDAERLKSILRHGRHSWQLWEKVFPALSERFKCTIEERISYMQDYVYTSLFTPNAGATAKIMLCLVLQIQQLDPNLDEHAKNLLILVERLLEPDEGPVSTLDGLECLMLLSEFYINEGSMRRVWSLTRRGVNIAQLIGLCRTSQNCDEDNLSRRSALWNGIWMKDRGFSLTLGLPYSVPEYLCYNIAGDHHETDKFLNQLGIIMGRVIDRDQDPRKMSYSITLSIDEELDECKKIMRSSFWDVQTLHHENTFELYSIRMRYYKVRKLLHLPFLLKSFSDRRYIESRLTALECSRAILEAYNVLRNETTPVLKTCDMAEFEALSASLVLVVNLWASLPQHSSNQQQYKRDWELVHGLKEDLERFSHLTRCKIAAQGAKLLSDICNLHETPNANIGGYQIDIPFFGKVSIRDPTQEAVGRTRERLVNDSSSLQSTPIAPEPGLQKLAAITNRDGLQRSVNYETFVDTPALVNGYLYPAAGVAQPWQGYNSNDWNSMLDLTLLVDWSWFPQDVDNSAAEL